MSAEKDPNLISISHEEANSSHVDDLLKRQMSMRGEPGVARDRGRRWFYQNWFVFSVVGMLAALAAWSVLEPFYYDFPYIQGPIEAIGGEGSLADEGLTASHIVVDGWIRVNGQKIWVLSAARVIDTEGKRPRLHVSDLQQGQTVGVYAHVLTGADTSVAVAHFVTLAVKKLSPERAAKTLEQLGSRSAAVGMLWFPLTAGFIGLAIGSVDGIICRLPRRALLSGFIGLLVGLIGGLVASVLANLIYAIISGLAMRTMVNGSFTPLGFIIQMTGRSIAWALAGVAMGLGQGIALRSGRLLVYGLLGGVIGGLLGGLLFDPIDFILLGNHAPSAALSRFAGFAVIGLSVGATIGIVELMARDAWLRMTQGPLAGKEFLLFKDIMKIGASPRSDIYLFNDPLVMPDHAILRATGGDEVELESCHRDHRVLLNNRPVQNARLRHNDQVLIGRTLFVYEKRKG